ncbi:mucin protein, partial [Biomphalaria glabrata]
MLFLKSCQLWIVVALIATSCLANGVVAVFTACGGQLTDQAGVILSPNFPNNYPDDAVCQWNITVAPNQIIDFRFKRLDLDRWDNQACYDSVYIYDGPSTQYVTIGDYYRYCGHNDESVIPNMIFRSTSNHMLIVFTSNGQNNRTGFSASYWAHECPPFTYGNEICNTSCICNQTNTHYCVSYNGTCACKLGWTSADCSIDVDECLDPNTCLDPYSKCVHTLGSFVCQCKPGMVNINGRCEDSKLCTQKKCSHACAVTSTNPRIESCYCPKGMKLDPVNNLTCVECDNWTYGENCLKSALCDQSNTKSYNKTNGQCHCLLGFTSPTCRQDINECYLEKTPCDEANDHSYCYNTYGSFVCACEMGYEHINETFCDACGKVLTASSGLIVADYHYSSYYSTPTVECSWIIKASLGKVISLSFQKLNLWYVTDSYFENRPAYIEVYDFRNNSTKMIARFNGGPYSSVPKGLVRSSSNEMYIVLYTGFYDSYYARTNSYSAFSAAYWSHECQPFTYGSNCTQPCSCIQSNTQYCNSTTGQCVCKPGWISTDCSADLDECFENPLSCPDYSTCANTIGSFQCSCKEGLVMNEGQCKFNVTSSVSSCTTRKCSHICVKLLQKGQNNEQCYCPIGMELNGDQCVACRNNRYGPDCYRSCDCVQNQTLSCDTRTGNCTCLPLWKGSNCSTDYDVCTDIYSKDQCQKYANCTDTGSVMGYRCRCSKVDGYIEAANRSCVPMNCSYILTSGTGVISSPLYPNSYMNNAFCTWSITVQEDLVISLRLTTFKTYLDDQLEIYDGENNKTRLIGQYTGYSMPSVVRTRGNKMYLVFKSNWVYNYYQGFNGTYKSHACRTFTYGTDSCNNLCRCVKENTEFCDNVNGECICKPGWTLGDCSQDVNECLGTNNKVCPTNSDCINTRGSYRCECHLGYKLNTTSANCEESKECLYKKCSHACYIASVGVEKCACPEGLVLDTSNETVCVVPYYPYGQNASDSLLSNDFTSYNNVYVSKALYFRFGAPYGSGLQPAAFVLSNGIIGFGSTFLPIGSHYDIYYMNVKKLNMVAPFMANINPLQGQVYHHLYEKCASKFLIESKTQTQASMLESIITRAEKNIQEYKNVKSFKVSTVLLVTWVGMQPYVIVNQTSEVNTFQAVYVTGYETESQEDAETAYVIFLYQYGLMNWAFLPERQIFIGTTVDFENIIKDLNTALVRALDSVPGNTGYIGVMSYKVGHVTGPQQSCKKYLCDHADLLTDPVYQYEKQQLYKCPCTLERLGAQWQLFERRGPKQDIYCYAISMVAKQRLLKENKRNMLCCYTWTKPANDDWRDWLQTWREATYLPKSPLSGHVLVNNPWYLGFFDNDQALENIRAHTLCCRDSYSADLCDKFHMIFPDMGCSDFAEFVLASALGDPHITTLDSVTYTMNGWGEYVMLEVPSEKFILQARTGRAETQKGTLTNATVFIGFAAKDSNISSFQVELSPSKTSLILKANGIDITNDFYKESGPDIIVSTANISVIREYRNNRTLSVATFPCGVSITVHVAVKSLLIEVNVPKTMANKTRGLLGNFNGNKNDEFILPDGQLLPANISDRQIYQEFAKKWAVISTNSVFMYGPGENTSLYQHPDFEPFYKDETNPAQLAEAEAQCGESNDACIFDYLATGDKVFARYTKEFSQEMKIMVQNLENNPPTVSISKDNLSFKERWLVNQGRTAILKLIATDKDNDAITFEIVDNVVGVSINQTGHIQYLPNVSLPIMLRVRVYDAKGSYSPYLYIPITICPSCNGKGVCNEETSILEEYENGWFQIQPCHCFPAFTGKNCESELNGCELDPCFKGQTCTDLTALQQGNSSVGYKCGPCPMGYVERMETCVDIDECKASSPCQYSCTNTEGSYMCSCPVGYRLDASDKNSCKDVNECEERTSKCEQKCINNMGNYSCSCYSGYNLDSNGFSCTLDPSKQTMCYQCQQVCQVTGSSQVNCSCRTGYEVDPKDTTNCKDVDECQTGNKPCSQKCINTLGAYQCSCYSGFKLAKDQLSCEACTSPYFGENCANVCQCNNHGSCDPVRGCVCNKQWTGANCEIDVNECAQPNSCPTGYLCENTMGSYKCLCPSGYKEENGQCKDINECLIESLNLCLYKTGCLNTNGSHICTCQSGFKLGDDGRTCTAECSSGTWGGDCSLYCSCGTGADHCDPKTGCVCKNGFTGNYCDQDIDECQSGLLKCASKEKCINLQGSATCACLDGYNKINGTCQDINECSSTKSNNCSQVCTNLEGSFICSCYPGYFFNTLTHSCTDVNECTLGIAQCEGACINTDGSYRCACPASQFLQYDGVTCGVTTPCVTKKDCSYLCGLLSGKEQCLCPRGSAIAADGIQCNDLDLCASSPCNSGCMETKQNTSFECLCPTGQILAADGFTCSDCVEGRWGLSCNQSCNCVAINTKHCDQVSGRCQCKAGWTGPLCDQDVDECQNLAICPTHTHCKNTDGGYMCVCDDGYIVKKKDATCEECDEGYFGPSCTRKCSCGTNFYCNKTTGSCYCKKGWKGTNCDIDINECELGTHSCDLSKETCLNTQGSYQCSCNDGFYKSCNSCHCKEFSHYYVNVTLDMSVGEKKLDDKNSDDYKQLQAAIETQLTNKLKDSKLSIYSVTVNNLRKGSLISDITILISAEDQETALKNSLHDLYVDFFVLDNADVKVIMIYFNGVT